LDHAQIFIVVYGGCFPCGSHGIATRLGAGLVVADQHNDSKAP
jgi:hypothetical protein